MVTQTDERASAKRRLILRDSLAFLSLTLVTVALFAVTLFLFRSFTAHRDDLAQRWSQRGSEAMQDGKPEQAIVALRTALSYAPGKRQYEMLLAQALGQAGHTEESYQYFTGLWTTEPGDGLINLELARLAAKRGDRQAAVDFYRASIYGTWEGDGVARRAKVRLELVRYLIAGHELAAARMELLIAGGNMPDTPAFDITLGDLLEQSGDPADALAYDRKALAARPDDPVALDAVGRLAYQSGDFESARRMLMRAQLQLALGHPPGTLDAEDISRMNNAARILELTPANALPARELVTRILADRMVAKKRFDACSVKFAAAGEPPTALQELSTRWIGPAGTANAAVLLRGPALQDSAMQLVYDTEIQTAKLCSAATGDDALLLLLANTTAPLPAQQPKDGPR